MLRHQSVGGIEQVFVPGIYQYKNAVVDSEINAI